MSITTPGSTAQAQAAFAGSNHVANPNPGWAALPPEPDWQVVPPRSPLAKLWAGDGQRDDWHMLLAMIFSGIAFVWVSEKLYRGRSKHAATSSRARRAGLIGIGCFYIAHNIVIVAHRYWFIGIPAWYEALWVCSLALPLATAGLFLERYHLIAAALASILAGHVIWAADTVLMLSHGDLTRTSNTLGIADYVNAAGKVTPLSVWAETHHLWFIPSSRLLLWMTGTPFRLREVAYGSLWVAFVSMVTVLLIPRPCVPVIIDGAARCFKNNVNMNQFWWGFESVDILHYFDYAKGTPAMITWVAHNFFYFTFNASLWLLFQGLGKVFFTRWIKSPVPAVAADGSKAFPLP